jgi:DNA-binding transcriptional LysR family regulator
MTVSPWRATVKYHLRHVSDVAAGMTVAQLRVLIAVADHRGFTAAAEHLQSSQPAVSRVIGAIERELQSKLFARHRDGVSPTETGLLAIRHARETVRHFDRLKEDVAAISGRVSGTLRVASLPSATGSLLAVPLRTFSDRHPHADVRLFEGTDQEVRLWLEQGAADVGVVTLPAPGYELVELGRDEMVAVLPRQHALAAASSVSFAQLAREPFIFPTGGCGPIILAAARQRGVTLAIAYEAREPQSIAEMVAAGLGVSVMPTLNLPDTYDGIATRPLDPRTPRTLAVALSSDASPVARAFAAELAERQSAAC